MVYHTLWSTQNCDEKAVIAYCSKLFGTTAFLCLMRTDFINENAPKDPNEEQISLWRAIFRKSCGIERAFLSLGEQPNCIYNIINPVPDYYIYIYGTERVLEHHRDPLSGQHSLVVQPWNGSNDQKVLVVPND